MRGMSPLLAALLLSPTVHSAGPVEKKPHSEYFEHFEGTKTCLACHEKEAENFFHSQHYQWRGEAPAVVNARGRRLGKMNTVNDFCTSPSSNWIGAVKNDRGDVITKGCSACHPSFGEKPAEKLTRGQLENIDCLQCHASGYQRDVYKEADGSWRWKPILWKNQEGLDSVSKRISLPTRAMCLRCHAASGGGRNFKRGDIEYALVDADRDYDVHMGTNGANMACVDCHQGEDHRVRGRGADLAGSDMPGKPLSCDTTDCHGAEPHSIRVLNRHAVRVACASCHIPTFARTDPTDMARDWSKPKFNEDKGRFSATISLQKDVVPVYGWWNGFSETQLLGEKVKTRADGTVGMFLPEGDRKDPKARLFPFKLHKGRLPLLSGRSWILPVNVEEFFADGRIDEAVKGAALAAYGVKDASYGWVDTVRYMGIFHGVRPSSKALGCLDCHRPGGRMDWTSLGYAGDPLDARLEKVK